jgi:hypothetical protein
MAIRKWLGGVTARAQVTTIVVGGTVAINDTITITIGYSSITVTATSTSTATTASQVQAALAANTAPPEFREITWTVNSSTVTGTARAAGMPFVVSTTPSASVTAGVTNAVAATGPNYADVAANWSGATLPTTGDTIIAEDDAPAILYGLTSNTALFALVSIEAGFRRQIGLPEWNIAGYREYRQRYWSINTSVVEIGAGQGDRATQIKLDLKSTASGLVVYNTGFQSNQDEAPLQIIGGSSATAVVLAGSVAFAPRADEAAGFTSIKTASGSSVQCGIGCTHTTIQSEGSIELANTVTNLNVRGGTCVAMGQATNIDIDKGTVRYKSAATITAATVGPGELNCSDLRTRTITTLTLRKNGSFVDPQRTASIGTLAWGSDSDSLSAE